MKLKLQQQLCCEQQTLLVEYHRNAKLVGSRRPCALLLTNIKVNRCPQTQQRKIIQVYKIKIQITVGQFSIQYTHRITITVCAIEIPVTNCSRIFIEEIIYIVHKSTLSHRICGKNTNFTCPYFKPKLLQTKAKSFVTVTL